MVTAPRGRQKLKSSEWKQKQTTTTKRGGQVEKVIVIRYFRNFACEGESEHTTLERLWEGVK